MKRKLHLLVLIFIWITTLNAQKHDYNWLFGYDYLSDTPGIEGSILNFNTSPVSIESETLFLNLFGTLATMSDASGNLAFYTNGCQIANANHELMQNGDDLNPGEVHEIQCSGSLSGYTSGRQSMLSLPMPQNPGKYYLFHQGIIYYTNPEFGVLTNVLYATQIDMNQNNGAGRVVAKNIPFIQDTLVAGKLTAVKHANGYDWWILTRENFSSRYYRFRLTASGFMMPLTQIIGLPDVPGGSNSGQANFSPDGSKYVNYSPADGIHLYDFDRSTGLLSNFRHIPIENDDGSTGGAAFSPNSRYLYVTTTETMMQFDTEAEDIAGSMQVVAEYDGFVSPFETRFWRLQLGPDCRLYCYCNSCDVIHVIQHPDEPGLACGVEQHAIQLPYPMFRSMPHFPNYRLGPLVEGETPAPPCVPVVGVEEAPEWAQDALQLYPNPANDWITLTTSFKTIVAETEVGIYNAMGVKIKTTRLALDEGKGALDISDLLPGIYFLQLSVDNSAISVVKFTIVR